ncbi:MAG: hypothetical protein ACOC23_08745 [Thermodesulfobacteriota bacterium]
MTQRTRRPFPFFFPMPLLLILWIPFLTGCERGSTGPKPIYVPPSLERILVVSFKNIPKTAGAGLSVRCPLSGKTFLTGGVTEEAKAFLNRELRDRLQGREEFKFISPEEMSDLQSESLSENGDILPEQNLLTAMGRKLGADAVLAGHIYRFQERVGGKYSVESAASVAFDLHLLRVSDGRVLWTGAFDETQKALTDDLFELSSFLERDGQWVTADQMAQAGLEKILSAFRLQ